MEVTTHVVPADYLDAKAQWPAPDEHEWLAVQFAERRKEFAPDHDECLPLSLEFRPISLMILNSPHAEPELPEFGAAQYPARAPPDSVRRSQCEGRYSVAADAQA